MIATDQTANRSPWLVALSTPAVWKRATIVGLIAGVLQVTLHQGDAIWREGITLQVVAKGILSPLIGVLVALASAVWVVVEREQAK